VNETTDSDLSQYADEVGADPSRLHEVFKRALEVVDIVRKAPTTDFTTLAGRICKHFGIRIGTSDYENLKTYLGPTRRNPDGSTEVIVSHLSNALQNRFVFYHELAHAMFRIQLLHIPNVSPTNIADLSEAEAWLFSVVCAVYDSLIVDLHELREFLVRLAPSLPERRNGLLVAVGRLFGASWHPLVESTENITAVRPVIIKANDLLLRKIAANPLLIRQVGSATFEDVMAELFSGLGYLVEQTQRTRDGGVDILAIKSIDNVSLRFLIECKRYAPHRKVDVTLVRALFGVKHDRGASKAIIATTSGFTRPARAFAEAHRWDLELKDFDGIMNWVEAYVRSKSGSTNAWRATQ